MNSKFVKIIYLFLILIFSINCQACDTNLDCQDTGCCHNNRCSSASKCQKINKIAYGLIGVGGFITLVLILIYFYCTIRSTYREISEGIKLERGSLARATREKLEDKKFI